MDDPFGGADIPTLVSRVIQVVLPLIGSLLLLMFVYGGVMYMFSQGNSEKAQKAIKILTNAAIGMAIVIFAYVIVFNIIDIGSRAIGG